MADHLRRLEQIEPNLYRHTLDGKKHGSYFAVYSVGGQRIKQSLETEDLTQARRLLKQRRAEDDKVDPRQRQATLAHYADKYLKTRVGVAGATSRQDEKNVSRIKDHFPKAATQPLRMIKASEVLEFIANFKKEKTPEETLGASDRNHLGWTLRKIFRLALADGVISLSPGEAIKTISAPDSVQPTPTWEDFKKIVAAMREDKHREGQAEASADVVDFYGRAGLGGAEAAALLWQDIDFARGQINVLRQKTSKAFTIDIYDQLRPLLEKLKAKSPNASPTDKVFAIKDPKKALAAACAQLNMPHYSPRRFRVMFITRCLERGWDPGLVSLTQGHRDGGQLILRRYRHVRPLHKYAMVQRLTDD